MAYCHIAVFAQAYSTNPHTASFDLFTVNQAEPEAPVGLTAARASKHILNNK